jgi:predicted O-methyltransferase YrrM
MVFIDAEKTGYADYYAWAVEHVRLGGIICAHNALRGGRVAAPSTDPDVMVMQEFNAAAARDARVISTLIPTGDGTLVAVRVR